MLHRDIKPDNVLLDSRYGSKVADFGLVKFVGELTSYTIRGTLSYMAPEVKETMRFSPSADVYSLGLTLLQLFTGIASIRELREHHLAELDGGVKELHEPERLRAATEYFTARLTSLDPSAGKWDAGLGGRAICVALKACCYSSSDRPSLDEMVEQLGSIWKEALLGGAVSMQHSTATMAGLNLASLTHDSDADLQQEGEESSPSSPEVRVPLCLRRSAGHCFLW